ncbi:MAG: aminotransferase class I/II-fold pyridoxal phosphate-dependent enzyme [Candidatus Woesearchaeota archaeon]|nr:aminotransferase class I/II-fold pyridoxal phosphate-dependent enzyme [Candidatus Woesearchaeota archaeon]
MAETPLPETGALPGDLVSLRIPGEHLMYGTWFGVPQLDFYDANTPLLPFGINEQEREALRELTRAGVFNQACNETEPMALEDIARRILEEETTFDLSRYRVVASTEGARHAIQGILAELVTPEKPFVFYASPNWIFDTIVGPVPGVESVDIFARTPDELIGKFEQAPESVLRKGASLIIVDPANPLGYRYSREQIERIETHAEKYGITPLFDDVFRGLQEQGARHASSEYSHNSIIVESTSKRFGPRSLGATWSLIPNGLTIGPKITLACDGCTSKAARTVQALHALGYENRMRDVIAASAEAFKQGYQRVDADNQYGDFFHAFSGMPIMTFHFKQRVDFEAKKMISETLGMTLGIQWISHSEEKVQRASEGSYPKSLLDEELLHGTGYMRICPAKETPERAYYAGMVLATVLQTACGQKK